MGDLDSARRSLVNLKTPAKEASLNRTRLSLLYLKIGDVDAARKLLGMEPQISESLLNPLLSMAEGRYSDAVTEWKTIRGCQGGKEGEALITQNLAVCLLYIGKLNEVILFLYFSF